jgi:hypothetical protein
MGGARTRRGFGSSWRRGPGVLRRPWKESRSWVAAMRRRSAGTVVWKLCGCCPRAREARAETCVWRTSDVQPAALSQSRSINSLILSKPSTSRLRPSVFFLCCSPVMSGQQCLRRLPCALRSVPALRAGARAVNRLPAARSYSAVSKASSSGLLGQAARCVRPSEPARPC